LRGLYAAGRLRDPIDKPTCDRSFYFNLLPTPSAKVIQTNSRASDTMIGDEKINVVAATRDSIKDNPTAAVGKDISKRADSGLIHPALPTEATIVGRSVFDEIYAYRF